MSRLFPNWLKHLCPARKAQTWRCHLVTFHQEQAFKELDFCLLLFLHKFEKSFWFICSLQFGSCRQLSSLQASMPIMAALFNHVTLKCISSYNGIVKFIVYTLGQQQEILLLYTAEYLWHDFNNHQAENYCLLFSSVELALLIIMISLETARVWC